METNRIYIYTRNILWHAFRDAMFANDYDKLVAANSRLIHNVGIPGVHNSMASYFGYID